MTTMTRERMVTLLLSIASNAVEIAGALGAIAASDAAPKGEPRWWICQRGQRGPVPRWVLSLTGLANKQEVIRKYGSGFKFVEGTPPSLP